MRNGTKKPSPNCVLLMIVSLFLISGALRFGGMGFAVANEANPSAKATQAAVDDAPKTAQHTETLLQIIATRTAELDKKEQELLERSLSLNAAEVLIEQNLVRMAEAEKALAETISRVDGAAEGDLDRLTSVYESMKPKVAASLFEQMTPDFAAGFLSRMSPQSAANIMSGLSAEAGYAISVVLAGRHVNTPTR